MSYQKAEKVLPKEVLELIQSYVDGTYLYIPRKMDHRKTWGENTKIKDELSRRNSEIYQAYLSGKTIHQLASLYFLSTKSIQRIVLTERKRISKT